MGIEREKLSLKWPNDVLLNGGKVAGILLESTGRGGAIEWLSIGVGVNLVAVPQDVMRTDFPPVSLVGEGGRDIGQDEFLSLLASAFATEERLFQEFGFARIREKWLRHAARLGEVIHARTAKGEVSGRFETVDEAGHLVLMTPKGRVTIPAAEVFF